MKRNTNTKRRAITPGMAATLLTLWTALSPATAEAKAKLILCPESGSEKSKELRDSLKKKYGIHPCMWSGYIDQPSEQARFQAFEGKAISDKLNAAYTYTIAAGEGLALLFEGGKDAEAQAVKDAQDKAFWIDGYEFLGIDRFVEDLPRLKERKLIPESFKEGVNYIVDNSHTNENDTKVVSADFKTLEDAMTAFTAALKLRYELMKKDAAALKLDVTADDQEAFWTYAYFCMGEGKGKKAMEAAKGDLHKFKATASSNVPDAIRQRVGAWRIVEAFSLFTK